MKTLLCIITILAEAAVLSSIAGVAVWLGLTSKPKEALIVGCMAVVILLAIVLKET